MTNFPLAAVAVSGNHAKPGIWFPLGDVHRIFYPGLRWSGGEPPVMREAGDEVALTSIPTDQVLEASVIFQHEN